MKLVKFDAPYVKIENSIYKTTVKPDTQNVTTAKGRSAQVNKTFKKNLNTEGVAQYLILLEPIQTDNIK